MARVRQLYHGTKVLMKYEPEEYSIRAEHDQIWIGSTTPDKMTLEDTQTMEVNGWVWDDDVEGWFIFT